MRADGLASTDSSTEQVDAQGLQDHLSDWDATPVPSSHAVKVAFDKVDTNRDGVIDESEWSAAAPPTGDAAGSAVDFNPIQRRAQQAQKNMDIVRNQKVFEKELEELADDGYDSAEDDVKYFESKVDLLYPNKWLRYLWAHGWPIINAYFVPAFCVFIWLFTGTLFYHVNNEWTWSQSFFYTCDNGFSVGYGNFAEDNNTSRWFTILNVLCGASLAAGALGLFASSILQQAAELEVVVADDLKKEEATGTQEEAPAKKDIQTRIKQASDNSWIRITAVWLVWISAGVWFGMANQGWDFTTSVYFAISSLSTAGLQGPNTGFDADCNTTQNAYPRGTAFVEGADGPCPVAFPYVFCACYLITGIPVFGICLGQLAGFLIMRYEKEQQRAKAHQRFSETEFNYAAQLGDGDNEVNLFQFMQLQMLKRGISWEEIEQLTHRFNEIDLDQSGTISQAEMFAMNTFDKFDVDESGALNFGEFRDALERLNYKDLTYITTTFASLFAKQKQCHWEPPEDRETLIEEVASHRLLSRQTFMYWWKETREELTKEERDQSMKDAKDATLNGILSDDEKQAYRMFRYIDADNNGMLDAEELQIALDSLASNSMSSAEKWTPQRIIARFGRVIAVNDADGKETLEKPTTITVCEFIKWWRAIDSKQRAVWYDKRHDTWRSNSTHASWRSKP